MKKPQLNKNFMKNQIEKPKKNAKRVANNTFIFIDNDINVEGRIIHLSTDIDSDTVTNVIKGLQLMYAIDNESPIKIFINSHGGCPYSALGLYSFIRSMPMVIQTYILGCAMSAASIIFLAGDERYVYQHSTLMLHSVSSFTEGKTFELSTEAEECNKLFKQFCKIYSEHSDRDYKYWHRTLKYEDHYYRNEEIINLKMADKIIKKSV